MSRESAGRRLKRAVVPPLTAALLRGLWLSARVTRLVPERAEAVLRSPEPFILAFWHCKLFFAQHALGGRKVTALISQHGDGELIARTMARFGHAAARGSSTRGGALAMREALRVARAGGSLAITPDGPKGPARKVKPGVIEIARAAGIPILPCSLAARPVKRLASWDRFEVPLPFARLVIAHGSPLRVERHATEARREALGLELEAELDSLTDLCERVAGNESAGGGA